MRLPFPIVLTTLLSVGVAFNINIPLPRNDLHGAIETAHDPVATVLPRESPSPRECQDSSTPCTAQDGTTHYAQTTASNSSPSPADIMEELGATDGLFTRGSRFAKNQKRGGAGFARPASDMPKMGTKSSSRRVDKKKRIDPGEVMMHIYSRRT